MIHDTVRSASCANPFRRASHRYGDGAWRSEQHPADDDRGGHQFDGARLLPEYERGEPHPDHGVQQRARVLDALRTEADAVVRARS
jgi:hypothetical protein